MGNKASTQEGVQKSQSKGNQTSNVSSPVASEVRKSGSKPDLPSGNLGKLWIETETQKTKPVEVEKKKSTSKEKILQALQKSPQLSSQSPSQPSKPPEVTAEETKKPEAKIANANAKSVSPTETMSKVEKSPLSQVLDDLPSNLSKTGGDRRRRKPIITAKCYKCATNITEDQFVMATEQQFHVNCFKCALCGKQLLPGEHILYDRYVYCKVDCIPASEKIEAPKEASENLGAPLELATHKGHPISQKCIKCSLAVRGTDYVISRNRVWHRVCFRCLLCKRHLTPGDHMMRNTDSFCRYPCYERKFVKPFTGT